MLVVDIQAWDPDVNRRIVRQVAIRKSKAYGAGPEADYRVYLLDEGARVPVQGPRKGKIPVALITREVTITGHKVADGDLELTFRAMRELRQEIPELFQGPPEPEKVKVRHTGLSKLAQP